jgi:prepilin-type N-terminal cleavage/methylation domain-containing protein
VDNSRDDGFSLIEVIFAIMIFALIAMAATSGFITEIAMENKSRNRVAAAGLAASEIDNARSVAPSSLVVGSTGYDTWVGKLKYHVQRDVAYVPLNSTQGACDGGANNGAQVKVYRVDAVVTWPKMGNTPAVRAETQISPEADQAATQYNIGIKVLDEFNTGVNAKPVTLTGPMGTLVSNSTSDGCAFFVDLDAGTYTATINTAGWVDNQLNSIATAVVTVPSGTGTTVTSPLNYTPSAILNLTMPGDATHPLPANVPVTISNPSLVPQTRKAAGTGAVRTIGPTTPFGLFPYAAGYQAWLGSCADADPEGSSVTAPIGPYYPGMLRDPAYTVTAGNTTSGTLDGDAVELLFKNGANAPVPGVTVTAKHLADSVCPAVSYVLNGTSDASGFIGATLPYGKWTLNFSTLPVGSTATAVPVTLAPGDATNVQLVPVTP